MQIININIDDLNPFKQNNKQHPKKQIDMIANSIQQFGFKNPIIIDKDNTIIAGHGRLLGAKQLGMQTVPCIIADDLTEEQVRAYRLLDNKIGDFGEYDMENIIAELGDIGDYQLGLESLDNIFADLLPEDHKEIEEDNYEIPEEVKTDIVLGDLFEIGEHRLLCGDSTKKEDVAKLMNGEKADILLCDPPYGIDLDTDYSKMGSTKTKYEKIKGDEVEFDMTAILQNSNTKEQYIRGGDYFTNSLDFQKGTQIVRAKRHSEEENKVFGSGYEILWVSYKCKKSIRFIRPINQSSERLGKHPTQKPIECMTRAIQMSKLQGIIIDLFLGSGSTMVASHQLNRKCYGMELDPKYCQVIIDRMIKLDPTLEIKKNGLSYNPISNG